jgi:tetratricopeptide (TPR) repeat protein
MSTVYTFYSYKGGVGRSMALANVAALLARWGHRVLIIDWDLDAPGLEKYFTQSPSELEGSRAERPGVVDIVTAFALGEPLDWKDCLLKAYPFGRAAPPLDIITAGRETAEYASLLEDIDWKHLFNEKGFGAYLEEMRDEWLYRYEFVLIDSRTGITDIGGICTIHLPETLVMLFTANEQSLSGVAEVMRRAQAKYALLPEEFERPKRPIGPDFERTERKLFVLPVPGRFERTAEYDDANFWLGRFAANLAPAFNDWLPPDETPAAALEQLYIPNIPKWSYGERLPVVRQGTADPRTIGYAYELLARLLRNGLQWKAALKERGTGTGERSPATANEEADAAFKSLSGEEQRAAQRVLANLVLATPAGRGEHGRRLHTPLAEFDDDEQRAIKKLADLRLLTVGGAPGAETVEITHDETLRYWERLQNWINEDPDFFIWRQNLRAAVLDWEKRLEPRIALIGSDSLAPAVRYLESRGAELSKAETKYIKASAAESRRVKRWKYVAAAVALAAALAAGLYVYSDYQQRRQVEQAQAAVAAAKSDTDKGESFIAAQQFEEAVAVLTRAATRKPDYAPAYLNRGIAYRNLNRNEEAKNDFLKAFSLSAQDSQEYYDAREYLDQMAVNVRPLFDPTPSPTPSPGPTTRPSPAASPAPNLPRRIYIQFESGTSESKAHDVAEVLKKFGYVIVKVQSVPDAPSTTQVRYYRYDEGDTADSIMQTLRNLGMTGAQPRYIPGYENSPNIRPNHFEIWFSAADSGP